MGVGRQKKGAIIRAEFLNQLASTADDLTQEFAARPEQIEEANDYQVQNAIGDEDGEQPSATTYIESVRTTTTVEVYDQNEVNYAEIERIDSVTFQNSEGDTITLQFNNE